MKEKIKSKKKFDDEINEENIKKRNKKKNKVNKKHSFRTDKNNLEVE